jgi:amino acid adenylation domain-containing protein
MDYQRGIMDFNQDESTAISKNKNKDQIETSIVARFKLQVEKYPNQIAFQAEHTSLTYHELDQDINSIAFAIAKQTSKNPTQIILLMEQNERMIASLFAVLATNHIYVPLDTSYPEARLAYIVQDCAATLILTDRSNQALVERLVVNKKISIILVDEVPQISDSTFAIQSNPDSLAYILYTSGTKGLPKGVLQNHRNVLHFNRVYTHALQVQANDRLTLLSSFCFDAAIMDIFGALLNGATLYPYSIKTNTAIDCLAWLETNKISIYHSTPSVFRYLFQSKSRLNPLTNLRLVVLGGEVALRQDWQLYHEHCPSDCVLVNGYGPTESSVTTQYVMNKHTLITTETLPIGYAVGDTTVFLKRNNETGEALEEIIIKSPYVALRYWGMSELSKKVFTEAYPDRQYHTGDVGRLLPDGTIEYRGRSDDQVKISGYRIELDEITHYLLAYPEIKQVVCLAKPHTLDGYQLAAYFIADIKASKDELSSYLKTFLPEYMIPTIFIQVSIIPKTLNGKVDREALITTCPPAHPINNAPTSIPNRIEKELIELCEVLLAVKAVNGQDNIFELGCNSLLAMQLTNRISQKFDIEFSIRYLFSAPTITDLSREITSLQSKNKLSTLSSITSQQKNARPLASYAQQQFLFLSKLDSGYDFSLAISVKMLGLVQAPLLQKAFASLIDRHEILRTILRHQDNQLMQIINDEPLCHLEVEELFHLPKESWESSIKTLAMAEASIPFDPLKGPLIRGKLLQYDAKFQVLLLCCSHSIVDGWALNIFSHELSVIYNALLNHTSPPLSAVSLQYTDYSIWQNQLLANNAFEHQRQYWMKQLANLPPPIQINKNLILASVSSKSTELAFALNESSLSQLQHFSEKHQVTLFMAILAIFQILLYRHSGQEDIIVGTPIANRHLPESESIMGCLVNTIALRGRPHAKISFMDFLQQIKEVTLDAYDNQDLPFSTVVESLRLLREEEISPVFQVMLTLENTQKYDFSLQQVVSEVTEISKDKSYFDLILSFEILNNMLTGKLKYKSDLFDENAASHFVNLFENLLLACVDNPQNSLDYLIESVEPYVDPLPALMPIPRDSKFLLSPAQQSIWFLNQVERNTIYNIPVSWKLVGKLNYSALNTAFQYLIARHESLRTTCDIQGNQPCQRLSSSAELELSYEDASLLCREEQGEIIRSCYQIEANHIFDITAGPLLKAKLIKLDADNNILMVTIHHLIADGLSLAILSRDLSSYYESIVTGKPNALPLLSIQYADYAYWQQQMISAGHFKRDFLYWKQHLKDAPPLLNLPTDRLRPTIPTYAAGNHSFTLPDGLQQQLQSFSQQQQVTLFTTLLTAFYVLLYRYAQEDDIVVGTSIANRNQLETKDLIGFFSNILALRQKLSANHDFISLLNNVKKTLNQAKKHNELPFKTLVDNLHLERGLNYAPIYQVMFNFIHFHEAENQSNEIIFSEMDMGHTNALALDMSWFLVKTTAGLKVVISYSKALFEESSIKRMFEHWQNILVEVLCVPETNISEISLLTEYEKQQFTTWNSTARDYPLECTIPQLFAQQVEKNPDQIAVIYKDQQLSYAELNQKANQVAHYLITHGVKQNSLVGICLERSIELVISLLGILKANAAYLPLDTELPTGRMDYILHDANPSFLITNANFNEQFFGNHAVLRLLIDEKHSVINGFSDYSPPVTISSADLLYVMYTSGSTGQPKGVMISHRGILNYLFWFVETFHPKSTDAILQKTSYCFDPSVREFFLPLLFGSKLIIAIPDGHKESSYLCEMLREQQISIIGLVPSMLRALLEEPNLKQNNQSVRMVISGGEELPVELQKRFYECFDAEKTILCNSYGPTEASIAVAFWRCNKEDALGFVPIGNPIANTQFYILDDSLQPVPIGVIGTLYIGGDSLAKGYLNRSELTKERFIQNPFSPIKTSSCGLSAGSCSSSEILYNTGDLCRWSEKGFIQFLGRGDFQIKNLGHRIELGEIENQFKQHAAIKDCIVIVDEDDLQQKKLIAYFIPHKELTPSTLELQQFLSIHLPHYMIPSVIISLPAFPLNSSGKLDRKALPQPENNQEELDTHYIAPRNHIEYRLSHIWKELLKISSVGVDDNFFYLGGHSLLAVQVIARISREFGVEVPLKIIFLQPTIAALAHAIANERQHAELPTFTAIPRGQRLPLSHSQQRIWFMDQLEHNALYNIACVWQLDGLLNYAAFKTALHALVARHESLRTTVMIHEDKPFQNIKNSLEIEVPYVDISSLTLDEQKNILASTYKAESSHLFDLTSGPLLRVKLIKLASENHVFLLTMHHIIADDWSIQVLLRDLSHYYESVVKKKVASLPVLPIQYADYAYWQRRMITEGRVDRALMFWQAHLKDAPPLLKFPTDQPRPAFPDYAGGNYSFTLSKELQKQLNNFSQQQQVTLFVTLLTTFYVLLHRYTAEEDIVVGTAIANRHHLETEDLIGFFANTLALRSIVSSETTYLMLLRQIRATVFAAQEHQDLPFEILVKHLNVERNLNYNPLFQVMFVLQNTPACDYSFGEALLSHIEIPSQDGLAKFDMTWNVHETNDGIQLTIGYSKALFNEETIARLATHWEVLLQSVIAMPQKSIATLPLLTEREKQIFLKWNNTDEDFLHEGVVHQYFEQLAAQYPDNIALEFKDIQLTYRELNERANQLAHYLLKQGIARESLVAVCLERSIELVIVIFGILKAGAAYLPLDTIAPRKRLEFILEDSEAGCLITTSAFKQSVVSEFVLDQEQEMLFAQPLHNPAIVSSSTQLIYAMYTSGSTGQPKGVLIEHRSVMNLLTALQKKYPLQERDAYLLKTSTHFDISVTELFGWFWQGGRLVILEPELEKEIGSLFNLIDKKHITHATFVPTLLHMWLKSNPGRDKLSSLKYVFNVGELISKDIALQILSLLSSETQFINSYGPTEATVYATDFKISLGEDCVSIPIGKALANIKTYILDPNLNPQPVGACGDIYIGGVGVARDYINRPDLSSIKFIADPFNPHVSSRMYKTGDKGRYLADGNIEFLGRADYQIKIRGFRVELGEIENYLVSHPDIQHAVVLVQHDTVAEKQLIAYFVPNEMSMPTPSALRAFLSAYFPDYMVPIAYVAMPEFPLNANGKVDRQAFPLCKLDPALEKTYIAPTNKIETCLVNIWSKILNVSQIGVQDNFFHLGGHSLLAVQILAHINREFRIEVPLQTLFLKPTIAALAHFIEMQKPQSEVMTLIPIARNEDFPLSPAQQSLWFLDQAEHSALYNISKIWKLVGSLNHSALKSAFHALIARHESLRTTFVMHDTQPYQIISSALKIELPYVDVSLQAPEEQKNTVTSYYQAEASHLFDLSKGPLLKVKLIKLDTDHHLLFLTIHHIIADGWSISVLLHDLSKYYESIVTNRPVSLPELSIQYADFTYWQQQMISGEGFKKDLLFWQMHLQDAPLQLNFPTDHPRPIVPDSSGGVYSFTLSKELQQQLHHFSQQQQVTLFTTVLTAFYVLLYRYTAEEDIVVGTSTASRHQLETEALIGYFSNALALRQQLSAEFDFISLLHRVNETLLNAQEHNNLPLQTLLDSLPLERTLNNVSPFQVMFNLQSFPEIHVKLHETVVSEIDPEQKNGLAKLDMNWYLVETTAGLKVTIYYRKSLFEESTIKRVSQHWRNILESMLCASETKISEISLLTTFEKQQLTAWNSTIRDYPLDCTIPQLFAQQVEENPDQIAVIYRDQQLTYSELNQKANQVAHYLIKHGVKPNSLVAICLERSMELVISLLGILKASAAYLPLDTELPPSRMDYILHDAKPSFLITNCLFNKYFFADHTVSRLLMNENHPAIRHFLNDNPPITLSSADPFYVMYTSGSTGQPKGVVILQQGILNRLFWMQDTFKLSATDTILQKTPYTTDTSVWEFFWPLLFGARLVLAIPDGHRDSAYLCNTIIEKKITVMDFVPSMLRLFLEEKNLKQCGQSLRIVISGGEDMTLDIQKLFFEKFKSSAVELYNLYGPTEASIGISYWRCVNDSALSFVPIGGPIANTQLYVLDELLQPVPLGVIGTLYIGGISLAKGYLNQLELTNERFIQNPFSSISSERLYNTGDLCRWSEKGFIQFLGRGDFQVKILGHRIEVGEIESQFKQHPGIKDCVVTVDENDLKQKKLIAYIIPCEGSAPNTQELQQFLSLHLPYYMIPRAIISLCAFPLNTNGKLDRNSLSLLNVNRLVSNEHIASRNQIESRLSDIWSQVLNMMAIGVYDNFFCLGGNSLLAVQIIARVSHEFNIEIPLRVIFLQPTIAAMAHFIANQMPREISVPIDIEMPAEDFA